MGCSNLKSFQEDRTQKTPPDELIELMRKRGMLADEPARDDGVDIKPRAPLKGRVDR